MLKDLISSELIDGINEIENLPEQITLDSILNFVSYEIIRCSINGGYQCIFEITSKNSYEGIPKFFVEGVEKFLRLKNFNFEKKNKILIIKIKRES